MRSPIWPQVELPILSRLKAVGVTELRALRGVDIFTQPQGERSSGERLMNQLGRAFRLWCKEHKIEKPPATWCLHLIGRGASDSSNSFPVLDSNVKASRTKPILFYLAELANEIASHCKCIWAHVGDKMIFFGLLTRGSM